MLSLIPTEQLLLRVDPGSGQPLAAGRLCVCVLNPKVFPQAEPLSVYVLQAAAEQVVRVHHSAVHKSLCNTDE